MDIKKIALNRMAGERRLTRETIVAMTDGDMLFKPTPEVMSFGGQALHIVLSQAVLLEAFQGKGWHWEMPITLEQFPTKEAILAKFDEVNQAAVEYYESLEPDQFGRLVETGWGPPEPLFELFFSFLTHETHHRGQMVTYLRLKGMQPPQY